MRYPLPDFHANRQTGAVLVTGLIILLVMTIIGVGAIRYSTLQEIMTGNLRDQDLAFQSAETMQRYSEARLVSLHTPPDPAVFSANSLSSTDYIFSISAFSDPNSANYIGDLEGNAYVDAWWNGYSISYNSAGTITQATGTSDLTKISENPRAVIEDLGYVRDLSSGDPRERNTIMYRITTRAKGLSTNSLAMIQTTYVKRYF